MFCNLEHDLPLPAARDALHCVQRERPQALRHNRVAYRNIVGFSEALVATVHVPSRDSLRKMVP